MVISLCSFDCSCILMCDVRDVRECYSIVRVYSCVMLCDVWECYSVVRVYSCVMLCDVRECYSVCLSVLVSYLQLQ